VDAVNDWAEGPSSIHERHAVLAAAQTTIATKLDLTTDGLVVMALSGAGPLVRYVDDNNWAGLRWVQGGSIQFTKQIAGTDTVLFSVPSGDRRLFWTTYVAVVYASGYWAVWAVTPGSELGEPLGQGWDAAFATGGTLASGKSGMYSTVGGASPEWRFDNYAAWVPAIDAAIFASQSVEIRHDRVVREDSGGTLWTEVSDYQGDLCWVPTAGREKRTLRWIVLPSRGNFDGLADTGIDDTSARLFVTPLYLDVPEPS
jgi:hypothetical protein